MRIRLHGVHFLRDATHEVSIRVVDDHGNLILQCSAYCDGPCYAPFTSHEDNTAAECASFCDLAVEAAIDGIALSAPLKPPYGADVERRKIVPRIVQIDEHVAVALSFQVSPDDREGYRARLTAFMQDHDPSNVSAVDDIMSSMSEINAFSFAWNEYGAESINDRLQHVANRYGLDDEIVEACVGELGSQEPEQWLETFVEFMLVNATLEANDLSHGSRALAMIRKYALNEDEVMTSMNDAEDPDDFIHELQSVFGPEPRLIDTAAYPVGSMSPRRAKPAQAPLPAVAPAAPANTAADSLDRRAASDDHVAPEQEHHVDPNRYNSDDAHRYDSEVDAHHQFHEVTAPPQADDDKTHHAAPPSYEAYNSEEGEAFLAAEASPYMPVRARTPEGPADATHDDPFEVPSQQVRPVSPPQPLPVQPPETDATAANEESEPLREPTDISHWAVPTASTGDAPADTTDAAVLRQSLLHMGRERDQLEAQVGELRHSTTQAAIAAQEEIDRLQRRVQELDEAVLGYRLSTEEALRRMEEAEAARASTQAALDDATEQIVNLKKSQARLCQAIETPGARIRLQVLFDEVEMLIPANVNVCLGDLRRAVIQRAIKLGVLSEEAVERRNLQLMLGKTVLYDDDTIEEMAIEATDRITVCELGAIVFANDPKPTAGSLPVVGGAASAAVSSPQAAAEPPQPTVYKPFVVPLSPEVSNDLCSHESLERRLLSERQRIEHDDLLQQEKRAFDAKIKLILDKARMRLVDRAAYGRSDDARAQARAAVARIDSAMRAGLSPDAMLGLARHADLTSEAMAAAEQRASTSSSSMGPVSSGDVTAVPNEMAARIEKRRAQCVSDLREMIDTLSHRVAIPPARLVDAEALVSKARSYVSLASSLSVEELQQCLRDIVNFMNQVRR